MGTWTEYFDAEALNGQRPLYEQIRDMIESYVSDNAPGTVMPSERELAARLKVNRRTLRKALSFFVADGRLERSARGTVIRQDSTGKPDVQDAFKSFLLEHPPIHGNGHGTLSLLIYENMPMQVEFWERTVNNYNRRGGAKIEIEWITMADFNGGGFFSWYQAHRNFDIYLMPPGWQWSGDVMTLPFSRHLREYMKTGDFFIREFCRHNAEYAEKTAIVGISLYASAWNSAMAESCGLAGLAERFRAGEVSQVLREASAKLPPGSYLSADYATIMADIGVPDERDPETLRSFFRRKLERIEIAAERGQWGLAISPTKPINCLAGINHFASGDCFFIGDSFTLMKMMLPKGQAKYATALTLPPEGYHVYRCDINLSLGPQCRDAGAAEDFLRYMLSIPIQRDLAGLGIAPVRKEALDALAPFDPHETERLLRKTRCLLPDLIKQFSGKLILHPYFDQLLKGQISVDDALEGGYDDFVARCSSNASVL